MALLSMGGGGGKIKIFNILQKRERYFLAVTPNDIRTLGDVYQLKISALLFCFIL